ncbi:hypothetical protein [Saccharolobus islandicus]|nr:hypothetical protein [Sulfolobus islandicus]
MFSPSVILGSSPPPMGPPPFIATLPPGYMGFGGGERREISGMAGEMIVL